MSIVATSFDALGSIDNDAGLFFDRPADGGGDIDGNIFENGDVGVTDPLFFVTPPDVPVRFSVSLSPPFWFISHNFVFVLMMIFLVLVTMTEHDKQNNMTNDGHKQKKRTKKKRGESKTITKQLA